MSPSLRTYTTRKIKEKAFVLLAWASLILALIPLISILANAASLGLNSIDIEFLLARPKPPGEEGGGVAPAIQGTLILMALASAIAVPLGVTSGIYTSEFGDTKLAHLIRFFNEVLAEVPSIIVGIFAYGVVVIFIKSFSVVAGAFALAIIMTPVIARTTEEALKAVPNSIKEAALALGMPRWKAILRITLSAATGGTLTGILLALARAAGETAPLLVTVGFSFFFFGGLDRPVASLPLYIFTFAISPFESWRNMAWGSALLLILMVLGVSVAVRVMVKMRRE